MTQETLDQTFVVSGPARLRVSEICGRVQVRPGPQGQLRVVAVKHLDSGDAELTAVEITQEPDGTVVAATRFPRERGLFQLFAQPCRVDYTITAPPECSVDAGTVSGDLDVEGLAGEFVFHSVSGDIRAAGLKGSLKFKAVSGDVRGEGLSGQLDFNTVSGSVRLNGSELKTVQGRSVSGDLILETGLGEGPYDFRTVSGDVRLKVPAEARFTAVLHTVSGEIRSNLPQSKSARRNGNQVVEVQGGGMTIAMNSVSGTLWVGAPAAA